MKKRKGPGKPGSVPIASCRAGWSLSPSGLASIPGLNNPLPDPRSGQRGLWGETAGRGLTLPPRDHAQVSEPFSTSISSHITWDNNHTSMAGPL